MINDKPRSGVLAVPESYQKRTTIDEAAQSLHEHYESNPRTRKKVSVGIGADNTLLLYVFTKSKIELPDAWKGYTVTVRSSGKVKPLLA